MSKMNESEKRDFVAQIISLVEKEQASLTVRPLERRWEKGM
jgi:hypothetical protein